MTYCSRCGVEVEERAEVCPLCEAPIQRLDEPREEPARYPDVVATPDRQVRYLVWILSTAALLSLALMFVTLDVVLNERITWSRYPLTGAGVIWLLITLTSPRLCYSAVEPAPSPWTSSCRRISETPA